MRSERATSRAKRMNEHSCPWSNHPKGILESREEAGIPAIPTPTLLGSPLLQGRHLPATIWVRSKSPQDAAARAAGSIFSRDSWAAPLKPLGAGHTGCHCHSATACMASCHWLSRHFSLWPAQASSVVTGYGWKQGVMRRRTWATSMLLWQRRLPACWAALGEALPPGLGRWTFPALGTGEATAGV